MEPEEFDASLPDGKTCLFCRDYLDCFIKLRCDPGNTRCYWSPSMFKQANGAILISNERSRQIRREGFTREHDDQWQDQQLLDAAYVYLSQVRWGTCEDAGWPWDKEWLKISDDPIRNLVKAGALIAAEIDRLMRLKED